MRAQDITAQARQAAIDYLGERGYAVLDRDWHSPDGDIPVVAEENGILVAVDIVAPAGRCFRSPLERMAKRRQTALRRAAIRWLAEHGKRYDQIRVDIIGLTRDGGGFTIEHIRAVG